MIFKYTLWTELGENIEIDMTHLEENAFKFYSNLIYKKKEDTLKTLAKFIKARYYLDNAIIILKTMIDPAHNSYVANYKEDYNWLIDNIGRIDKRIDKLEEDFQGIRNAAEYTTKPTDPFIINTYKRILEESMNHLVFYPLKKAKEDFFLIEFQNNQREEIKKDKDFFIYLVFRNQHLSSEVLGSITREEKTFRQQGKAMVLPSRSTLPIIPENIATESRDEAPENIVDSLNDEPDVFREIQ